MRMISIRFLCSFLLVGFLTGTAIAKEDFKVVWEVKSYDTATSFPDGYTKVTFKVRSEAAGKFINIWPGGTRESIETYFADDSHFTSFPTATQDASLKSSIYTKTMFPNRDMIEEATIFAINRAYKMAKYLQAFGDVAIDGARQDFFPYRKEGTALTVPDGITAGTACDPPLPKDSPANLFAYLLFDPSNSGLRTVIDRTGAKFKLIKDCLNDKMFYEGVSDGKIYRFDQNQKQMAAVADGSTYDSDYRTYCQGCQECEECQECPTCENTDCDDYCKNNGECRFSGETFSVTCGEDSETYEGYLPDSITTWWEAPAQY